MRIRILVVFSFILFFLCSLSVFSEECPKTGTSFDALIKEAYDTRTKFIEVDLSVDNGVNIFKDFYATVMEKSEEEKEEIMAMTDSSFFVIIADSSVKAAVKEKLTEDSKATLDTLKIKMDDALSDLRVANDAALELSKKIPEAIKKLPSELKGMNAMKIPKVKAALEKAKGWMDDIKIQFTQDAEVVNTVLGVIGFLFAEDVE
ncbi:MAG: hypothetical protein E3J87_07055 [Candidatus Cloacimonadota bacterium]|nr:MAG: hypothetical protein E3J87_07055 [Candidatus Cloacimonadota bacterium]